MILVECRRHTTSKIDQEQVGGLVFRIIDTGAEGGLMVTPLGFQAGAELVAKARQVNLATLNPDLHFPRKHRPAATGQGVMPIFRRRQVSDPAGQARIAEVNRPPVGPFACDRTEALIALRVRKSNFHVSYRTDQGVVIPGHASEVARFRQRAPVHLWVFWESAVLMRPREIRVEDRGTAFPRSRFINLVSPACTS